MSFQVIVTQNALAEYKEIYQFLKARFGKRTALRFKTGFAKLLKTLAAYPFLYEAVPERENMHKCSVLAPTLVYYRFEGKIVEIVYM